MSTNVHYSIIKTIQFYVIHIFAISVPACLLIDKVST